MARRAFRSATPGMRQHHPTGFERSEENRALSRQPYHPTRRSNGDSRCRRRLHRRHPKDHRPLSFARCAGTAGRRDPHGQPLDGKSLGAQLRTSTVRSQIDLDTHCRRRCLGFTESGSFIARPRGKNRRDDILRRHQPASFRQARSAASSSNADNAYLSLWLPRSRP